MEFEKELVAASTTPLILAILVSDRTGEESYGYAIIKRVRQLSGDQMEWTEGMLYPVLHRLERNLFVESYWAVAPETHRRRKYYRITDSGVHELRRLKHQWQIVDRLLRTTWNDEGIAE